MDGVIENERDPDNTTDLQVRAIVMPGQALAHVFGHLRNALPNEGCGLFGGTRLPNGDLRVDRFYPGTNALHSPSRFRMADEEVIRAMVDMREAGIELVGIVHSHPAGNPTLSPTDLAEAFYRNIALMIVGLDTEPAEVRVWTVKAGEPATTREIALKLVKSH